MNAKGIKKIVAIAIAALFVVSITGIQAKPGMETYTNEDLGCSFEYPASWTTEEYRLQSVLRGVTLYGPKRGEAIWDAEVVVDVGRSLPKGCSLYGYAKDHRELQTMFKAFYSEDKTYNTTINGEPAVIMEWTLAKFEGSPRKWKCAYLEYKYETSNLSQDGTIFYNIAFVFKNPDDFKRLDREYFEPLIQSFELIEGAVWETLPRPSPSPTVTPKPPAIVTRNLTVSPSTTAIVGDKITFSVEAVNEGDITETRTINFSLGVLMLGERTDWEEVTLASGESKKVEFTYTFNQTGGFLAMVGDCGTFLWVVEESEVTPTPEPEEIPTPTPTVTPSSTPIATPTPTPEEGVPGFEFVFAIAGLLTVAYLLRRKG